MKWLVLAPKAPQMAYFTSNWSFRPQNVLFWVIKSFKPTLHWSSNKSTSDHISHDIDQKNGPPSEFSRLYRPWMVKFSSKLTKNGLVRPLFGPQIDFLEPQNIFFWLLKCFKSFSGHISYGIDQKNCPLSEFPGLNRPSKLTFFGPQIDLLEPQNIFSDV